MTSLPKRRTRNTQQETSVLHVTLQVLTINRDE